MKNAMKILLFGADAVEEGAERVGDATGEEQEGAAELHVLDELGEADENAPAVEEVADDFEGLEFVGVDGGENDADRGNEGNKTEEPPAECAADADERDWDVGAENEEEDVTMVEDAEDFLAGEAGRERVINAGDDVEDDHCRAEDGAGGAFGRGVGFDEHEDEGNDAKDCAEAVANGVPEFFSEGISWNSNRHANIIARNGD